MGTAANAQCVILFGSHARGEAGENSDVEVISIRFIRASLRSMLTLKFHK